jgi:hypothetical protein
MYYIASTGSTTAMGNHRKSLKSPETATEKRQLVLRSRIATENDA